MLHIIALRVDLRPGNSPITSPTWCPHNRSFSRTNPLCQRNHHHTLHNHLERTNIHSSPTSIRSFCNCFLPGRDQRIDAIIFAHEYHRIGLLSCKDKEKERDAGSSATLLTLLLPLLIAPVERGIQMVNIVKKFYAAAATTLPRCDFQKNGLS